MEKTLESEQRTLELANDPVPIAFTDREIPEECNKSDTDSADEDEEAQLETLEREVSENPLNYEAHAQYIKCLRKLGHIEKLRSARESMNSLFPLSPTMWKEWAKDEASLSTSAEAFTEIEKIYERGVQEYLSVPLWCAYLNFVQEHDPSITQCQPAGIQKMRDLFEQAITAAGLHIIEGGNIWEAYREFEQAYYLTIDDSDTQEKTKQIQCIRSLFHRQLSVPHADLSSTLHAYKLWECEQGNLHETNSDKLDGIPPAVMSAYQKALEKYNARLQHESLISSYCATDFERVQHFLSYIKFEESSGDPNRVQLMYERAVTEFPISSDLWLGYTRYVDKALKVPFVVKAVYSRATRNCSWIGELWVRYMLALERVNALDKELSAVFEQSLQCVFSSLEEYLDLFLTRIDGLRRRICLADSLEDGLNYAMIREIFQRAVEYLSPLLKNTDPFLRLHAYWARLESKLGKDLVAARGVWESLIKTSGTMLEAWQGYIAMEIEMGNINEARSIYKRCYRIRFQGAGSEDLCISWLRFEREFGTLADFDHAVSKVTPRLEELRLFQSQQEPKHQPYTVSASTAQKENFPMKSASKKRKPGIGFTDKEPDKKRQKETTEKPSEMLEMNDAMVNGNEASSLPEVAKPETTNEQLVGDSSPKEAKMRFYSDQCTAFISNLSLKANDEHLHDFFSDVGGVTSIRILKERITGKSRGLAYVDFSDDEHLEAAIAKNKQKLLEKKISIYRSDPKRNQRRGSSESSSPRGRGGRASSRKDQGGRVERSEESTARQVSSVSHRRGGHIQLVGSNTFAVPRAVRPLGSTTSGGDGDDKPKSNDEFRKMLLKS